MPGFDRENFHTVSGGKSAPVSNIRPDERSSSANQDAEDTIASAQKQFIAAIDSVSDGFALFDADDRLVFCNRRFREQNPVLAPSIVPGVSFEELLRENIRTGQILDAIGEEAAYIRTRMEQHRNPSGPLVQQRGGRTLARGPRGADAGWLDHSRKHGHH